MYKYKYIFPQFSFYFSQKKKKKLSCLCIPWECGSLIDPMIIKTTLKLLVLLISYIALLSS